MTKTEILRARPDSPVQRSSERREEETAPEKISKPTKELLRAVKAGRVSVWKLMLWASGSQINVRDGKRRTALHYACASDDKDAGRVVDALVRAGAMVNARDVFGRTPLHEACRKMNKRLVIKLLKHKAKISLADDCGWTPLHLVCYEGMDDATVDIVRALLAKRHELTTEEPTKHWAGHLNVEEILHTVNLQTRVDRNTALHMALQQRPSYLETNNNAIYSLLRMDAEVELKRIVRKMNALSGASETNVTRVVCLLLAAGAKLGVKNIRGMTALHYACKCCAGDVVQILVERGESVNAVDDSGNTPLHLSCSPPPNFSYPPFPPRAMKCRVRTIETLLSRGAKLDVKNALMKTPYDGLEDIFPSRHWRTDPDEGEKLFIEETFIKHVVKRRWLNLPEEFHSKWRMGPHFYDEVKEHCCLELETMKSTEVVKGVSLYGVLLHMNQPYHLSPSDFQKVCEFMISKSLQTKFPLYCKSLLVTFLRSELLTLAVRSFYKQNRKMKDFPYFVAEQILAYMSNQDLKNFMDSA